MGYGRAGGAAGKSQGFAGRPTRATRLAGGKFVSNASAKPAYLTALARVVHARTLSTTAAKSSPTSATPDYQESTVPIRRERSWGQAARARRQARATAWWLSAATVMVRHIESGQKGPLPERAPAYAIAPDGVDAALMLVATMARHCGLTGDHLGAWHTDYKEHLRKVMTENG